MLSVAVRRTSVRGHASPKTYVNPSRMAARTSIDAEAGRIAPSCMAARLTITATKLSPLR